MVFQLDGIVYFGNFYLVDVFLIKLYALVDVDSGRSLNDQTPVDGKCITQFIAGEGVFQQLGRSDD